MFAVFVVCMYRVCRLCPVFVVYMSCICSVHSCPVFDDVKSRLRGSYLHTYLRSHPSRHLVSDSLVVAEVQLTCFQQYRLHMCDLTNSDSLSPQASRTFISSIILSSMPSACNLCRGLESISDLLFTEFTPTLLTWHKLPTM